MSLGLGEVLDLRSLKGCTLFHSARSGITCSHGSVVKTSSDSGVYAAQAGNGQTAVTGC